MKNVVKLLSILLLASGVVFTSCKKDKDVTGLKLNEEDVTLAVGDDLTLTATVEPSDAKDKTVTWTSSNTDVVTVSDGKLTAIKVGTAKITAKAGNIEKICLVTVVTKIDDYYAVQALAGYLDTETGDFDDEGLTITTTSTPPFKFNKIEGMDLMAIAANISGKTIPVGTPVKYRLLFNGTPVEFTAEDGSKVTYKTTKVTKEVEDTKLLILHTYTNFSQVPVQSLGNQVFRVEVLQVGKKEFAQPSIYECTYEVKN